MITSVALVTVNELNVAVQLEPGQPASFAPIWSGADRVAVTLTGDRPFFWLSLRLTSGDAPVAGCGFWPGAALPPLFVQVYWAVPLTNSWAVAGSLPRPLTSNVAVAPERHVAPDTPELFGGWVIHKAGFRAPKILEVARLQAWTLKPAIQRN